MIEQLKAELLVITITLPIPDIIKPCLYQKANGTLLTKTVNNQWVNQPVARKERYFQMNRQNLSKHRIFPFFRHSFL